jgi:hypothetical protein
MKFLSKPNNINSILLIIGLIILIISAIFFIKNTEYFSNQNQNGIVIPNIRDGLGNQLFIVAAAFSYAKRNNKTLMFDSDKKEGVIIQGRPLYLNTVFSRIPVSSTISLQDNSLKSLDEAEFNKHIDGNVVLTGGSNYVYPDIKYINNGYYQCPSLFNKYRSELLSLLKPTDDMIARANKILKANNINKNIPMMAIHIRLDDHLTRINHENRVYSASEYDAINSQLHTFKNIQFIVFSNDIKRAKLLIRHNTIPIKYISDKDYIELTIMTMCTEYIASPSTFNWWGIYLNPRRNKKIHIFWKVNSEYRQDFIEKYQYLSDGNDYRIIYHIPTNSSIMTCVSGYWDVTNKHGNKFNDWFKNTLIVNCPYVFYTTSDIIENIKAIRYALPTFYINKSLEDFKTYDMNMTNEINDRHCPSKDLGYIWLEKINLMKETASINPYQSEWFSWIDAGISIYRNTPPASAEFPNPAKLYKLSKKQVNYCSSDPIDDSKLETIKSWAYVHNISGTIILHKSIITKVCDLFYEYLEKCIKETKTFVCYSDQCIWTRMYVDNPSLFNKVGDGYGNIIKELE